MSGRPTFIERHGLWSDEQQRQADDIARRLQTHKLRYVRLAWSDAHGYARAKTLTIPAFAAALRLDPASLSILGWAYGEPALERWNDTGHLG